MATEFESRLTTEPWSWMNLLWALGVVVILPNMLMGGFAGFYSLERPEINADYAIVMLLALANYRALSVLMLFVVFCFDVLALVGQVFPVLKLSDIIYMLKFVHISPAEYKVAGLACLVAFFVLAFFFIYKNEKRGKLEWLVCVNVIVCVYGYYAIFSNKDGGEVWSANQRSAVSSQVIYGIDSRRTGFVDSLYGQGDLFSELPLHGATSPWFESAENFDEKMLLIINESWGQVDGELRAQVLLPLTKIQSKLADWEQGEIDFNGITIEAEIRELCQADLEHFNFDDYKAELSNCLPNTLKKAGYKTASFHGAAGPMYARFNWYPWIGFDETVFFESQRWPRRCYSFPGACDYDMVELIADSFSSDRKAFSYWLTLNSHHSYDLRDLREDGFSCESVGIDSYTEVCRNLKLQYQFFQALSDLVSMPQMVGVRVVVVSDHEPRISNKDDMDRYFDKGVIPWLSFKVI